MVEWNKFTAALARKIDIDEEGLLSLRYVLGKLLYYFIHILLYANSESCFYDGTIRIPIFLVDVFLLILYCCLRRHSGHIHLHIPINILL